MDEFCKKYSSMITNEQFIIYAIDYNKDEAIRYIPAYMAFFL